MKKIKKIFFVIIRKIITIINYFDARLYTRIYCYLLKKEGLKLTGDTHPNYIDPSVYFDGVDYSLISIGSNVVISKDVLILTHDFSIFRALKYIGREKDGKRILKPVSIGNNVFIGARSIILPGSIIEDNVVVGAGTVVKGTIKNGNVVAGNPAKIIKRMDEYANSWIKENKK